MSGHQPWPFPKNRREGLWTAFVIIALLCAASAAWGLAQHRTQERMLGNDDIQRTTQSLTSYAGEAAALAHALASGRSPQAYQEVYLRKLHDETVEVQDFLNTHEPQRERTTRAKVQELRTYADMLRKTIQQLQERERPALQGSEAVLHQLQEQLRRLGESSKQQASQAGKEKVVL